MTAGQPAESTAAPLGGRLAVEWAALAVAVATGDPVAVEAAVRALNGHDHVRLLTFMCTADPALAVDGVAWFAEVRAAARRRARLAREAHKRQRRQATA